MKQTIAVLGDGACGCAIAHTLAQAGHALTLWCYDAHVADAIRTQHQNTKYLPGIALNKNIAITTAHDTALAKATLIFEAIPVQFLRKTLELCAPFTQSHQAWVLLSKGIEKDSLALSSDIVTDVINPQEWCVISGPSYAHDVALQQPTGFTLATTSAQLRNTVPQLFPGFFSFDYSENTTDVQLYGALKNLLAIGMGIVIGAGFTDNTQALIFTRLFNEITHLIGTTQSMAPYSFAALGDALLTGYGALSKNKRLGLLIGKGMSYHDACAQFPTKPEGVNTIIAALQYARRAQKNVPCLQALSDCIHGTKTVQQFIVDLARVS